MSALYRRVPVQSTPTEKGRLPEKEKFYGVILNPSDPIFTTSFFNGERFIDAPDCTHWLEPVGDLPTEEEIMEEGEKYKQFSMGAHPCTDIEIFHRNQGAKWVINKILNKKH